MPRRASGADPELLARLLDAVADPIFVKDRGHRFVFVNAALCALVGRPREELLGRSDYDFFPKAQADVFWRQDELVFESGRDNLNEETLTDAAGRTHRLVTKKSRWKDARGRARLIGVIREVTELAAALEEVKVGRARLRRSQKLELVGRLAGGIAHDFNNVLAAVLGGLGDLVEALPDGHPARGEADEVRRAGESAGRLARRLITLSSRPDGEPRALDPRAATEELKALLTRVLPGRARLELSLRRTGFVRVDPGRFEQVLLNLVVNAGDAMPRGGAVRIELVDEERCALGAPCVRLTVRDEGEGLSKAARGRLFEPYFTTKARGTGLGLATVDEIVRGAGGRVTVESASGEGAAFHAHWPRVRRTRRA
jgi:PAS domain S-box-containing protein